MKSAPSNTQHLEEILRNREVWDRKPVLQKAYRELHNQIRDALTKKSGLVVELGSGIGAIKKTIPECITTDIFANPWLDRCENAYKLSFADTSISNLILFDVFHHLEFPRLAFQEFDRVIVPGGRLILMEPGFGLLGRFIYGNFHHEPVGFGEPINWEIPEDFDPLKSSYYAAQANAWRIFLTKEFELNIPGWRVMMTKRLTMISYVATGGFSHPSLYPAFFFPFLRLADEITALLPSLFSTRFLVVLEK